MSIPVITLSELQAREVISLRDEIRGRKTEIERLTTFLQDRTKRLDSLLHEVALSYPKYKKQSEEVDDGRHDGWHDGYGRLIPTLSEDGRSVVLITRSR